MKFRLTPVAAALTAMFAVPAFAADEVPAAAAPTAETAAPAAPAAEKTQLPAVKVTGQIPSPYKPEKPASPKYTEPLRDIPQTIQVIPAKVIEDQNQLTLRDMLGNVPGITFGAAEGGNGFGDNITLRGARVDSDIFVDGIRDAAQTARVDPFNLEQLEVAKGASSVYSGAGAVSGTINMVSKTAKDDEFTKATLGVGTDSYYRATVDSNQRINDTTALRLNVMSHENDSPGRDEVSAERWGIAGSLAFGLGSATRTTLNVVHQNSERIPDRGILWRRIDGQQGRPVPVDRSTYFGWSNLDHEEATVDAITGIFEKDIKENLTLRNVLRYASTDNVSSIATVNGLVCIGGARFGATTGTCPTPPAGSTDTFTMTGAPGNLRDDTTDITSNVTDLTWKFKTGTIDHTLVGGLAITRENFDRTTFGARDPDGTQFTLPTPAGGPAGTPTGFVRDLHNPDTIFVGPVNYLATSTNANEIDNKAIYAFYNVALTPQVEVNAGLRYERNDAIYDTANLPVPFDPPPATAPTFNTTRTKASHHLKSGRLAVTFKPVEAGSIYVAVGNSSSPASSAVITSCTTTNCNTDPEETINYEIGTKWDIFDQKLLLTAAIFRNDRTNTRVASSDPANPIQVLDGESRVEGIELGAMGQITKEWSISAGYAYLDSEILNSIDKDAPGPDLQKGQKIIGTPEQSGSLWTTYAIPRGFEFGYGLRYVGEYNANFADATNPSTVVPDYVVHNALIGYQVNRDLHLRLNANNLTDKTYWTSVRPQGWGYPGEGRSFVMTASYNF